MDKNKLVKYKNNPIIKFIYNLFNKNINKPASSIVFDADIENAINNAFENEIEQQNIKDFLKELISRNNNLLETIDIRMLNKSIMTLFKKEELERIFTDKYLQERLIELPYEELETYNYILNYNVTDFNDRIGNTLIYPNLYKNITVQDLEKLSSEEKTKTISILLGDSAFKLSSIDQLNDYYKNKLLICKQIIDNPKKGIDDFDYDKYFESEDNAIPLRLIDDMKYLSEIDRIKYAIIEAKYGMSLNKAQMLCDAFGQEINELNETEETRIIKELKEIINEKKIDKLERY